MTRVTSAITNVLCVLAFAACASQSPVEKKVEAKVQKAMPTSNPLQLGKETVFESNKLSSSQKKRLKELYGQSTREQERIRRELGKHQTVLMKQLVDPKAKDDEIELLKNRILELERDRTSLFMNTLDRAESILGRKDLQDERFYRAFLMNPVEPDPQP